MYHTMSSDMGIAELFNGQNTKYTGLWATVRNSGKENPDSVTFSIPYITNGKHVITLTEINCLDSLLYQNETWTQ